MTVLCVGDVVGQRGLDFLVRQLPVLKRQYKIDAVIVNGENSADSNGITPASAEALFNGGADVITTGNHAFRRREVYEAFDSNPFLLRPLNYPASAPGKGHCVLDFGRHQLMVVNLMGTVYMESLACPFEAMDALLENAPCKNIIVDFHAEATAEKRALCEYLDGRITALFGTHTHVQTADEQILPKGTGFITDAGMTGPAESVLGVKAPLAIAKMKDKLPVRFEVADGPLQINAVLFDIDPGTGKALSVERLCLQSE